ncbi:hypothetical protein ACVMYR_09220 [Micromonospora sp. PTRAS2]
MSDIADPSRHVVLTVDVERYSGRDNVLQWRVQQALPRIMQQAQEELGLCPDGWLVQPSGDGQLAILPQGTSERTVVTRLAPTVDRLLREHNHGLAPEARIRLRIGVHEGLVHLDGGNGFPGEAVVTVCRLVDSPQLKAALRRFPDAQVALIVSDRLYQDVVRHYGDLRPEHFLRVTASLPEKSFDAVAWIHLPGENAATATAEQPIPAATPDQPAPATAPHQSSAGGQTFQHITAHGPAAFGNGNVVTTYGSADGATPHRP